jgi:hypothetical protein
VSIKGFGCTIRVVTTRHHLALLVTTLAPFMALILR